MVCMSYACMDVVVVVVGTVLALLAREQMSGPLTLSKETYEDENPNHTYLLIDDLFTLRC